VSIETATWPTSTSRKKQGVVNLAFVVDEDFGGVAEITDSAFFEFVQRAKLNR